MPEQEKVQRKFLVQKKVKQKNKVQDTQKHVDGYNIKNSYIPEVVNISGEKTWNDNDDQDGKRPESIKVTLYKMVAYKLSLNL